MSVVQNAMFSNDKTGLSDETPVFPMQLFGYPMQLVMFPLKICFCPMKIIICPMKVLMVPTENPCFSSATPYASY